jgi:hypothetical protein
MKLRCLLGLMVLAWAGCSDEPGMDEWVCYCPSNITFALSRPLPGPAISISVEQPDGTVERLDCQPTGGSLACLPLSSALAPNFDANGALQSVTIDPAETGSYIVELTVDGVRMGGGTFNYAGTTIITGACGETCVGGAQTVTIGD